MSIAIHANEKSLVKIFSDDFSFVIPPFQRPYAWTIQQASELLSDLMTTWNDGGGSTDKNPYFLGSIVLIKSPDSPDSQVIDGQQRLTTLTILIAALRDLLPAEKASYLTQFIYQAGNPFAGTENRYRLQLRSRDQDFFRTYIQEGSHFNNLLSLDPAPLTDSQRNIYRNAKYLREQLQKMGSPEAITQFASYIMNQCYLVVVSTPDLDAAYRIFSVLNTRGLDLSVTDLLKSDIIGSLPPSKQDHYTTIWESEEEKLGRGTFQDLFSHIRMIYRKNKLQGSVLTEFRKFIMPIVKADVFIDSLLKPYAQSLSIIKSLSYEGEQHTEEINDLLGWLNQIDNSDWIPPALLFLSRHQHTPSLLLSFFKDLERLAAGMLILRSGINERISRYAAIIEAIERNHDLSGPPSPLQLSDREKQEILTTLNSDLYLLTKVRRYVLLRLDSLISEGGATYSYPTITVEHVLPQNPKINSTWMQDFPTEEIRNRYVHRLGNLVLLSRYKNAEAQNDDFTRKKQKYFLSKKGASPFALTSQVLQYSVWTPDVIEQRQRMCLNHLKSLWRL